MKSPILLQIVFVAAADDYCGKSDIPKTTGSWNAEIQNVHVFFRHGARTDFHRTTCFPNKSQTRFSCSLTSEFSLVTSPSISSHSRLSKSYKDGCQVGQLLDYAKIQMNRLAEYLKSTYAAIFTNATNKLYLRSTDTVRTLGSLDMLLGDLFASQSDPFVVHTQDTDSDALIMGNQECELANQLDAEFLSSKPFLAATTDSEYFKTCARMWKAEIGTDFNLNDSPDCLFAPECAGVPLPNNLVPSKELSACVSNIHSTVLQIKYGAADSEWKQNGIQFCQLKIAPFLSDFYTLSQNASSASSGLWATHDDTIACILAAMGAWDGVWPKYAGFVAFETHKSGAVRVIRDGIEIAWKNSIDLIVPPWMRNPNAYMNACSVSQESKGDNNISSIISFTLKSFSLLAIAVILIII